MLKTCHTGCTIIIWSFMLKTCHTGCTIIIWSIDDVYKINIYVIETRRSYHYSPLSNSVGWDTLSCGSEEWPVFISVRRGNNYLARNPFGNVEWPVSISLRKGYNYLAGNLFGNVERPVSISLRACILWDKVCYEQ